MNFAFGVNAHFPSLLRNAIKQLLDLLRILNHIPITFTLSNISQRTSKPQLLEFASQFEEIFSFFDLRTISALIQM